jgi:uncharacterized protein (TIGR02246 family)
MSKSIFVVAGVLVFAAACAAPGAKTDTTGTVDVTAETQKLLETDRAWSVQASAGKNADSVLTYWTDDARVVMPGAATLSGKEAIGKMVRGSMTTPGFHITWTPEQAFVSKSGDMGYTIGTNEVTAPDAKGKLTTMPGRYLTVWRKDADGRWRCVQDFATPSPATATGAKS